MQAQNIAIKNAQEAYGKNQVSTASQKKLLLMLYDGAIRDLEQAKQGLMEKDYAKVSDRLVRAQDILTELMVSLDLKQGGDFARNLYGLYGFMQERLIQANLKKNHEYIEQVQTMLNELREAWKQV